jgi:hypothetical protein
VLDELDQRPEKDFSCCLIRQWLKRLESGLRRNDATGPHLMGRVGGGHSWEACIKNFRKTYPTAFFYEIYSPALLRRWLRSAKSIFLSRYHLDKLGDRPLLFDNRIHMIILDSVTKKFGGFAAVDNVSYTIQKGESFATGWAHQMTLMLGCFNRKEIWDAPLAEIFWHTGWIRLNISF